VAKIKPEFKTVNK